MEKIITELRYFNEIFPRDALKQAIERKDEMIPLLLAALDEVLADPRIVTEDEDYMLHVYGLFLLAQFREKRAFSKAIELISLPPDDVEMMWGDGITEDFSNLLYSTYNGDLSLLEGVIENPAIGPYVRGAVLSVLGKLHLDGEITQEYLMTYLRKLIAERAYDEATEFDFNAFIQDVVVDCGFVDMIEDIRSLYDKERIDRLFFGGFDEFVISVQDEQKRGGRVHYINDVIEEMHWWACFEKPERQPHVTEEKVGGVVDYVLALTHLYGIVHQDQVVDIYNQQNDDKIDRRVFEGISQESLLQGFVGTKEDYFVHETIIEYRDFSEELAKRKGKPYYIPERQELLNYVDDYYVDYPQAYYQLLDYAVKNIFNGNERKAEIAVSNIQGICQYDFSAGSALEEFERQGAGPKDHQQMAEVVELIIDLANNTRIWDNNGHTPHELSGNLQSPRVTFFSNTQNVQSTSQNKVGRNDPCPCGSGKKYKKCCIDKLPPKPAFSAPREQLFSKDEKRRKGLDDPELRRINALVDEGSRLVNKNDLVNGCDRWLEVWETIKRDCQGKRCTLDDLDRQYRGTFFVSNLLQDLEMELHNAGVRDPLYFEKRITYCQEVCELLPNEDESTLIGMRRAVAESYASLGNYEQAEQKFQELVKDYPNNPWGFIGWGDLYLYQKEDDYDRAKEFYQKGLAVAGDHFSKQAARERLKDAEKAAKKAKGSSSSG